MANDRPDEIDVDDVPDGTDTATFADTLVARGRAVVDRVDMGVVAALGFALGVSSGLVLAGAPRVILALSAVPVALTLRSAMTRGVRPARLVN